MTAPIYFVYPFGVGGDLMTIPTAGTGVNTGYVSYQYGFTPNYQLNLNTNTSALPIPRNQFNQLMFDVTNNLQQYWQYGTPFPILSTYFTPNAPWPYVIYARIYYDSGNGNGPQIWENQLAGNTDLPTSGSDNNWNVVSGQAIGNPIGTVIDFVSVNPPSGYLSCDGSQQSRSTYANLFGVITLSLSATLNGTTTVSGLANYNGLYVGMPVEGTDIASDTTISAIPSSFNGTITISIAATGSGTETLTFFPFGNGDGSSTFNIPLLNGITTAGQGGNLFSNTPYTDQPGQSGGAGTVTLVQGNVPPHTHTYGIYQDTGLGSLAGGPDWAFNGTANTGTGSGSSMPFSIVQPTSIMNKCIKF